MGKCPRLAQFEAYLPNGRRARWNSNIFWVLFVLLLWQQFYHWCCINKNQNSQFCLKTKTMYPTQSNNGSEDNMGTMYVYVPSRTPCLTLKDANRDIEFFWQKETGAEIVAIMATAMRVSFCFFFAAHLWCQAWRTLLQYFRRYRLFSIFHFFVANNITSKQLIICIIERCQYLWNENRYFKKKNAISTNYFSLLMHFKRSLLWF